MRILFCQDLRFGAFPSPFQSSSQPSSFLPVSIFEAPILNQIQERGEALNNAAGTALEKVSAAIEKAQNSSTFKETGFTDDQVEEIQQLYEAYLVAQDAFQPGSRENMRPRLFYEAEDYKKAEQTIGEIRGQHQLARNEFLERDTQYRDMLRSSEYENAKAVITKWNNKGFPQTDDGLQKARAEYTRCYEDLKNNGRYSSFIPEDWHPDNVFREAEAALSTATDRATSLSAEQQQKWDTADQAYNTLKEALHAANINFTETETGGIVPPNVLPELTQEQVDHINALNTAYRNAYIALDPTIGNRIPQRLINSNPAHQAQNIAIANAERTETEKQALHSALETAQKEFQTAINAYNANPTANKTTLQQKYTAYSTAYSRYAAVLDSAEREKLQKIPSFAELIGPRHSIYEVKINGRPIFSTTSADTYNELQTQIGIIDDIMSKRILFEDNATSFVVHQDAPFYKEYQTALSNFYNATTQNTRARYRSEIEAIQARNIEYLRKTYVPQIEAAVNEIERISRQRISLIPTIFINPTQKTYPKGTMINGRDVSGQKRPEDDLGNIYEYTDDRTKAQNMSIYQYQCEQLGNPRYSALINLLNNSDLNISNEPRIMYAPYNQAGYDALINEGVSSNNLIIAGQATTIDGITSTAPSLGRGTGLGLNIGNNHVIKYSPTLPQMPTSETLVNTQPLFIMGSLQGLPDEPGDVIPDIRYPRITISTPQQPPEPKEFRPDPNPHAKWALYPLPTHEKFQGQRFYAELHPLPPSTPLPNMQWDPQPRQPGSQVSFPNNTSHQPRGSGSNTSISSTIIEGEHPDLTPPIRRNPKDPGVFTDPEPTLTIEQPPIGGTITVSNPGSQVGGSGNGNLGSFAATGDTTGLKLMYRDSQGDLHELQFRQNGDTFTYQIPTAAGGDGAVVFTTPDGTPIGTAVTLKTDENGVVIPGSSNLNENNTIEVPPAETEMTDHLERQQANQDSYDLAHAAWEEAKSDHDKKVEEFKTDTAADAQAEAAHQAALEAAKTTPVTTEVIRRASTVITQMHGLEESRWNFGRGTILTGESSYFWLHAAAGTAETSISETITQRNTFGGITSIRHSEEKIGYAATSFSAGFHFKLIDTDRVTLFGGFGGGVDGLVIGPYQVSTVSDRIYGEFRANGAIRLNKDNTFFASFSLRMITDHDESSSPGIITSSGTLPITSGSLPGGYSNGSIALNWRL